MARDDSESRFGEPRRATTADIDQIVELINAAYEVEKFFVRGPRIRREAAAALLASGEVLVVEDARRHLAAVVYVELRGNAVGYFGLLSVRPDLQSAGLGRAMVSHAEMWCIERGCRHVELNVVDLREELHPWYEAMGYRPVREEPFEDPSRQRMPCHLIVLSRDVTSGPDGG